MKRRLFLKSSLLLAVASLSHPELYQQRLWAFEEAITLSYAELESEFAEGHKILDNSAKITLNIPTQPGSASTVPVEVTVESPMLPDDYIESLAILTTKNKVNKVVIADFTPANGLAYLYVNIKLGQTQEVVVLAMTNNKTVYKKSKKISVAINGCQ